MKIRILALGAISAALLLLLGLFASSAFAIGAPPPDETGTGTDVGGRAGIAGVEPSFSVLGSVPQSSRLLATRFGVTLTLQYSSSLGSYHFNWNSFTPTKNVDTVDWVESDWYGSSQSNTRHGIWPSGGEEYDVEALYFDNDDDNFYIAIVTSVPFTNTAHGGIGVYYSGYWVRPGDLSINLGLNSPRSERYGNWQYDYGLDLVHDDRNSEQGLHDTNLGNQLYRTTNDAGGWDDENPSDSDWYTSGPSHNVQAGWEHTNFDPIYSSLSALGSATVAYYRYDFADGHVENGEETWVIEATIPRSLFGSNNPGDGDDVGIRWVEGCRNDGNSVDAVIHLDGDVDAFDLGDLPDGYGTTLASNGARHELIAGGPILGLRVDADNDGQPDALALGDDGHDNDDEDGVMRIGDKLIPGEPYTLSISGTLGATLDAWFDWDNDGVLSDTEHFSYTLTGDWATFAFTATTDYTYGDPVYARFRVSTGGVDSPTGAADDGEVEDYLFQGEATAVVLASFTASAYTNAVLVKWESATELDTMGYHIERADAPAGPWTQLNESLIGSRAPGSMLGAAYDHLDLAVEKGRTYYYRLVSIDTSGGASYYGPLTVVVPSIGEPLPPRSLAGPPYRIFLPFVMQSR